MILMLLNVPRDTVATLTSTATLSLSTSLVNGYGLFCVKEEGKGLRSYWNHTKGCQEQRIADNGVCVFYDLQLSFSLKGCRTAFRCSKFDM